MADLARLAERVWRGDDAPARAARAALAPAAMVYEGIARARGALYDRGVFASEALALPSLSVGNLTVGGTGKTPVAAWFAARLRERGARPAIVMRGYGDDEPLVHRLLAPDVTVVTDRDRVRGVRDAARLGADVAVLDDAFQHRRARRDVDVVLLAADSDDTPWLLPAGPYREPMSALARATAVIVTRKTAADDRVSATIARVSRVAPHVAVATVSLQLDALHEWPASPSSGATPLALLAGERVLAIAAVGAPSAFFAQLEASGARVTAVPLPDHHAFTADEAIALARRAEGVERVVCTLKDAVKLGPLWPRLARSLWYVSQRLTVQSGEGVLDKLVARLLAARTTHTEPTGSEPRASDRPS